MAQSMPESVKTIRASHSESIPVVATGKTFEIKLAPDEVMILLAFNWWWTGGTFPAGINEADLGLWRKSETLPAAVITDSPDMVWSHKDTVNFVTESIKLGNGGYVNLPWPMVLVRPPQFVIRTTRVLSFLAEMRLFYLLREVGAVDLAKLMVKDHA